MNHYHFLAKYADEARTAMEDRYFVVSAVNSGDAWMKLMSQLMRRFDWLESLESIEWVSTEPCKGHPLMPTRLITTRNMIQNVAKRWAEQYARSDDAEKLDIGRKLTALDKQKATPEDVAAIIGNPLWTRLDCNNCGASVGAVVMVGDEPDYESATCYLCAGCAVEAASLITGGDL